MQILEFNSLSQNLTRLCLDKDKQAEIDGAEADESGKISAVKLSKSMRV